MINRLFIAIALLTIMMSVGTKSYAQQPESVYGDEVKFDVRMKYVFSLEDAFSRSIETNKPIFVNCFADWAVPCHGMNKYVFSDQAFADYMDQHFVCLFLDVKSEAGKSFAKKYDVEYFAHYLVLNSDGEVLLRVIGGQRLPEFKDNISLALDPTTSLPGAQQAYEAGGRDRTTLLNYLRVLYLGQDSKTYRQVDSIYLAQLNEQEYCKKENWTPITMHIDSYKSKYFQYITRNKAAFVTESGEETVNKFVESVMSYEVFPYTVGETPYDAMELLDMYREMKRAALPDSAATWAYYQVAKLRGENKATELYNYLKDNRKTLGRYALDIDRSLSRMAKSEEQKAELLSYLKIAETIEPYEANKKQLKAFIAELSNNVGIAFVRDMTFEETLAKAKAEGKRVFMDCYTTWCGPCKMMANDVFPLKEVGDYFNPRYVSIKMDMESTEGRKLMERYKIQAFPTMLILNNDGEEINRIVGAYGATELINKTKEK